MCAKKITFDSLRNELKRKEMIDCAIINMWRFLKSNGFKFQNVGKRQSKKN